MNNPQLQRTAKIRDLRKLRQAGLLRDDAFEAAVHLLRPSTDWLDWARQLLLLIGGALVLVGVVFFFAYNWSEMGKFLKFALIEGAILACLLFSRFRIRSELGCKMLILSASVMTGVLLAVFGQTYQTGADAYELFVGWAALITAWVLVAEFAALWMLWLVLLNTAAILYWTQVGEPRYHMDYEWVCLGLALLNGTALVLTERAFIQGIAWLRGQWFRFVLFAGVLTALSIPTIHLTLDETGSIIRILIALIWLTSLCAAYVYYRHKQRNKLALSLVVLAPCPPLLTLIGRILFNSSIIPIEFSFLLFALAILGVVSRAALWYRAMVKDMAITSTETGP